MHKELSSLIIRLRQITDDKDGELVVIVHSSLVLFHCSRGGEGALPYVGPVVSMNIIIESKIETTFFIVYKSQYILRKTY